MPIIKKGIELIVFSNLWIAFASAGLTINTYLLTNNTINTWVILFVFFATFSIYNLQRLVKHYFQNKNYSLRHQWIFRHVKILVSLVFFSSLFTIFLFFYCFSFQDFLYFFPFALISVLYSVSLFSEKKSLRDLPFTKIFLIAITWAVTSVILPIVDLNLEFNFTFLNLFVFNFLFIIAITIPFDIRDINLDSDFTKTLPQHLGINKSINLAIWILTTCLLIASFSFFTFGQISPLFVAFFLILKSKDEQPELFYSGIIDGIILLFPLLNYIS